MAALIVLVVRNKWSAYWALGWFLIVRLVAGVSLPIIIHFADRLEKQTAYRAYFFVFWVAFGLESVLALLVLYNVLRVTMGPLRGLRRLASLVFCALVAVVLLAEFYVVASSFPPHANGMRVLVAMISQLQRTQSMVAILILLTVVPALRVMGLSFRSPVFGSSGPRDTGDQRCAVVSMADVPSLHGDGPRRNPRRSPVHDPSGLGCLLCPAGAGAPRTRPAGGIGTAALEPDVARLIPLRCGRR